MYAVPSIKIETVSTEKEQNKRWECVRILYLAQMTMTAKLRDTFTICFLRNNFHATSFLRMKVC